MDAKNISDATEPGNAGDSDLATRTVKVTLFKNEAAQSKRVRDMTLPELAHTVTKQTAASKMELPWLKLAVFGAIKSDKGCLRTNINVVEITGIEVEHDSGETSFDVAVAAIREAGLRALLYTSPSYVPEIKERWRILLPLSQHYPPEMRENFVARINGLFDGKIAPESFTLSQAYLFGHIDNAEHRVETADGDFLDLRDDLYAGSIFKDGSRVGDVSTNKNDAHVVRDHDHDHDPVVRAKVEAALAVISSNCSYEIWRNVGGAIHHEFGESGREIFVEWSSTSPQFDADECETKWRGVRSMNAITAGTIFHLADQVDPSWRDRYEEDERNRIYADLYAAYREGISAQTNQSDQNTPSEQPQQKKPLIIATPYIWTDPTKIPPREWLYGRRLIRKYVSATVAQSGIGKSQLEIAEMLAMVSGEALLDIYPPQRLRCWYWNLEDPRLETERRIQATAKHYHLCPEDLEGFLFVDCGREQSLVIAKTLPHSNGALILRPVVDALVAEMKVREIDVLIIDPFVSSHHIPENDNSSVDMVVKEWGAIADRTNSAVELVHHIRKGETEVTAESSRGGGSFVDGSRAVRVCNRMSGEDAKNAGVDNPRLHFRAFSDKINMAPPADKSDWYRLVSVDLCNGPLGPAVGGGDAIGVVAKWEWPDHTKGITGNDFDKVAAEIRAGKWRAHPSAMNWVGNAVARALRLTLANAPDRAKVVGLIKYWLACGSLVEVKGLDERRKEKTFVEVKPDE